jgi:hypothetical protein
MCSVYYKTHKGSNHPHSESVSLADRSSSMSCPLRGQRLLRGLRGLRGLGGLRGLRGLRGSCAAGARVEIHSTSGTSSTDTSRKITNIAVGGGAVLFYTRASFYAA